MIKSYPLSLLSLKDPKLIAYANKLLPRDTGIEFEALLSNYRDINDDDVMMQLNRKVEGCIKHVNHDRSEQRWRIASGIKGFCGLWLVSKWMCKNCQLNPGSGNHYHIDFTKEYGNLYTWHNDHDSRRQFVRANEEWVLNALDSWDYKGSYNRREFEVDMKATWVNFRGRDLKTIEYRIGDMEFDYNVLLKKILHLQNITEKLGCNSYKYKEKEVPRQFLYELRRIRMAINRLRNQLSDTERLRHYSHELIVQKVSKLKRLEAIRQRLERKRDSL